MSSQRTRIAHEMATEIDEEMTEESLDLLLTKLDLWQTPAPSIESTAAVIERLRPLVPAPKPERFRVTGLSREPLFTFLTSLLLQARLLGRVWWIGTALALPVGYLLALSLEGTGISPAIIAPPVVILGLLWALVPMRGAALQVELTSPVNPAQVLLGRLLVSTGTHLVLGGLLWLLLGAPGALLLPWTAALFLFSGLTLLLTLYAGTLTALAVAAGIWGTQFVGVGREFSLFAAPWADRPAVQLIALGVGLGLIAWSIGRAPLHRLLGREG
ncbi:MAG TPA: hypothetical protein VK191_12785 [Symbiobacteriaceae bacterium]|nr:hypothetical protein [Symbiobacteriaceae bacterium]